MKTIQLKATEFANFQTLALQMHIAFTYEVKKGKVNVTAPEKELKELGY